MEPEKIIPAHPNSLGGEHKIVETYAEDIAKVLENDTEGLVKKIIHGEEEHEAEKKNFSPESSKNRVFMLVSLALILLGMATLLFFYAKKQNVATVDVQKQFIPLVFNDKTVFLEALGLNSDEIKQTVSTEVNAADVKEGGLEGIYLTENKNNIVGLRRFLTLTKSNLLPLGNPIFVNDDFLMGAVNKSFFILLKVRTAADIFDAMRDWEGKMFSDLHKFLGIDISSDTNYLLTKDFADSIVENKNARILYDKDGKIVLMYVYADDNSVVITNSQPAVHEIILRLASAQKKQ